ncbi:MAG: hypothetical protein KJ043_23125, partial [Anaerolineae bacterium]|nr:hypothetical protein [Anaerolineae bacterium]
EHPYYTTLPVYESLKDYILTEQPALYTGVHQADNHWVVEYAPDSIVIPVDNAEFGEATRTDGVSFYAVAGDMLVRWRGDSITICTGEGENCITENTVSDDWQTASMTIPQADEYTLITLSKTGIDPILIDSITIIDRRFAYQWGFIVIGAVAGLMTLFIIFEWLRGRAR